MKGVGNNLNPGSRSYNKGLSVLECFQIFHQELITSDTIDFIAQIVMNSPRGHPPTTKVNNSDQINRGSSLHVGNIKDPFKHFFDFSSPNKGCTISCL